MNMDLALVNRALGNLGKEEIADVDRQSKTEAFLTAKAYYLQTMLETLERVEWTSALLRRELAPWRMPLKGSLDFALAYEVPYDCARPVELNGREPFKVEGAILYTDADPARLLYVSNGRVFCCPAGTVSGGNAFSHRDPDFYISGGDANSRRRWEPGDSVMHGGGASREQFPESADDYPDYRELRLEPNFYWYWECLLTAKYASRLEDEPGRADIWLAKAVAVGRDAQAASRQKAAGRRVAAPTWQEELGLA